LKSLSFLQATVNHLVPAACNVEPWRSSCD
jgi:hypothetical protein